MASQLHSEVKLGYVRPCNKEEHKLLFVLRGTIFTLVHSGSSILTSVQGTRENNILLLEGTDGLMTQRDQWVPSS